MSKHTDDIRRGLRNPNRYSMEVIPDSEDIDATPNSQGHWCLWSDVEPLIDELYVLRNKVEWLQKADRLVIWNGTEWQVRHVIEQPIKPRE